MKKVAGNISAAVMILLLFHSAAHAFNLPDTGQTLCYNTAGTVIDCVGTGQDGEYSINPMAYTDHSNGTVTDDNTGLMWQKCSMGQTNDAICSGTASVYTGDQAATTGCGSLNTSNFGGHNDWRLPSKKELITIVDYSVPVPGPTIKASFPGTQQSYYWSSTAYAYQSGYAWSVYFHDGSVIGSSKSTSSYYVRCVRGVQTLQGFTNNGDGTVTDSRTGLMWQKCNAGQNFETNCIENATTDSWSNALGYCNGLTLPPGVNSDWRLPNVKELESLTDDAIYNPAIDTTFFTHNCSSFYWSSTTGVGSSASAWYVSFYGGSVDDYSNSRLQCVRCVRAALGNFVRLVHGGGPVGTYPTFHGAYAAALDTDVIQARAVVSTENLSFASALNIHVSLKGGYDSGFTSNTGFTTVGSLTISHGSVMIENLKIK